MIINDIDTVGLASIISSEGVRLKVYDDATDKSITKESPVAGYATIGVGHKLTKAEIASWSVAGMSLNNGIKQAFADNLLRKDLMIFVEELNSHNLKLNQNQYNAIISFMFNVGIGAFRKSTLLKRLKANDYLNVPAQLRRWVWGTVNGSKVKILTGRREREIAMWNKPVTTTMLSSKRNKVVGVGALVTTPIILNTLSQVKELKEQVEGLNLSITNSIYGMSIVLILIAGVVVWTKYKDLKQTGGNG